MYEWLENTELKFLFSEKKAAEKFMRLTLIPAGTKIKAETDEEFFAQADARTPGFSEFASKWGIQVKHLRHLQKFDAQLVRHVLRNFNPQKAKPENALQKYTEALSLFPQRWRVQAIAEDSDLESLTLDSDNSIYVGNSGTLYFSFEVPIDPVCEFLQLKGDFYLIVKKSEVFLNNMKIEAADGPVDLRDVSSVRIGDDLIFAEIAEKDILDERLNQEPQIKRIRK